MKLKFHGTSAPDAVKGLKPGETITCSDDVAEKLLKDFPNDFELLKEHAPAFNKMYAKTPVFKSK